MGAPIDTTITLFFSKLTYGISPVYLFSMFFFLDIIRMLILILFVLRISLKSNNFFYNILSAIVLISGITHMYLFLLSVKIFESKIQIKSAFFKRVFLLYIFIYIINWLWAFNSENIRKKKN